MKILPWIIYKYISKIKQIVSILYDGHYIKFYTVWLAVCTSLKILLWIIYKYFSKIKQILSSSENLWYENYLNKVLLILNVFLLLQFLAQSFSVENIPDFPAFIGIFRVFSLEGLSFIESVIVSRLTSYAKSSVGYL